MDAIEPTPHERIDPALAETKRLATRLECLVEASGGIVYGVDRAGRLTFVELPVELSRAFEVPKLLGSHHHVLHAHHDRLGPSTDRATRPPDVASCVLCKTLIESLASSAERFSGRLEIDDGPATSGVAFHGRLHPPADGTQAASEAGIITLTRRVDSVTQPVPDITDAVSEAREARAALVRLEEDYTTLVRVASHDLAEPLRAISNFSQILSEDHRAKFDTEAHQLLDHVTVAASRLQALLDGLRSYSRLTTRANPPSRFSARAALDAALESLESEIAEAGATITAQALPDLLADRSQIERLFELLVSNAIRFRSEAPVQVDIRATLSDGCLEFSVADNGIGIDPGVGERPFLIFQRLHPRGAYPGIGLGLSLARQIVERHGGTIRFEPAPGRGTRFLFTLPEAPHA